jgi:hypothetical protein
MTWKNMQGSRCRQWVVIGLLSISPVAAADLNAPAEKRPTIGSELIRGRNVTLGCETRYWDTFHDCMNTALGIENRKNTDTDAFLLGVYGSALVRLTEYEQKAGGWSETNGRLGVMVGKEWYGNATALQGKLDITDEQLSTAIGIAAAHFSKAKLFWRTRWSVRGSFP